jgi:hypothetical protein
MMMSQGTLLKTKGLGKEEEEEDQQQYDHQHCHQPGEALGKPAAE